MSKALLKHTTTMAIGGKLNTIISSGFKKELQKKELLVFLIPLTKLKNHYQTRRCRRTKHNSIRKVKRENPESIDMLIQTIANRFDLCIYKVHVCKLNNLSNQGKWFLRNLKAGLKSYGKGLHNHIKILYQHPYKSVYMFITFVHDSRFKHFEELRHSQHIISHPSTHSNAHFQSMEKNAKL